MNILLTLFIGVLALNTADCSQKGNKVLLLPYVSSSHYLNFKELAFELQLQQYEVSILMQEDCKYQPAFEGMGVEVILYPGVKEAYIQAYVSEQNKKQSITSKLEVFSLILTATKNDPNWVSLVQSKQFDLVIKEFFPPLDTMARILAIPKSILLITSPIDQMQLRGMIGAPYHSTMISSFEEMLIPLPKHIEDKQNRADFTTRFKSLINIFPAQFVFSYLLNKYQQDAVAPEHAHHIGAVTQTDLVLSTSIEGVLDQNSVPPHVKTIYPLSPNKKFESKPIPGEILSFMDSHEKIILVCFGSTFKPKKEFLEILAQFARSSKKYGIIVSLKRIDDYGEQFDQLKTVPNIHVAEWLPQLSLLQSGRISFFYSHGGFNSLMESLECGVPMIITPLLVSDQQGNCKRVALNEYGYCLENPTLQQFERAVQLFEENDYFKEKMAHVKKVVEIKKRDPHDVIYWVKQVLEVGTSHLIPKDTVNLNFVQLNDLDIHFALFTLILMIALLIVILIRTILKCICGKTAPKQKAE